MVKSKQVHLCICTELYMHAFVQVCGWISRTVRVVQYMWYHRYVHAYVFAYLHVRVYEHARSCGVRACITVAHARACDVLH